MKGKNKFYKIDIFMLLIIMCQIVIDKFRHDIYQFSNDLNKLSDFVAHHVNGFHIF